LQYCLFNNDVPKYYSPFRSDTRPASGLLHAAYSFCNVLQFYEKISKEEARLAQWAQLSIERYYFNVLLCLELLEKGNDLSARGMNLVHEMQKWITIFSSTQNIKVRKNVIDEKNQHFNDWLTSNQDIGIDIATIYSKFITNNLSIYHENFDDNTNYELQINEISLDNFIDTYKLGNTPIIVRNNSLVNYDEFIKSIEDSKHTPIQLLESKKHKGFPDTPSIGSSLESHINSFNSDNNAHQYFSVIRDFSSITKRNIWKDHHFFDDFWIDEGETWIFINSKGLEVPLHNDSVNNLHCVITGSKTFYLSPPSEAFILSTSISDYNSGFSDYNPFLNKNKSIQYGQFIRLYEGDMLYLPNGWWHSIYYDEDTMAASAFDEFVI
jgi:hypothetical protein